MFNVDEQWICGRLLRTGPVHTVIPSDVIGSKFPCQSPPRLTTAIHPRSGAPKLLLYRHLLPELP